LVPGILQIVGMVCRMLTLAPALTAATLVVAPLMGLLATGLGEVVRRSSSRDVKASSDLSTHIAEVFSMFEFVTIQGALSYELGRLNRLSKTFLERRIGTENVRALLPVLMTFVYTLTIIFLFATSCWLVGRKQISSTNVVAFCTTLVFLMEPIQGVSAAFNEIKQNQASLDRLLRLVNMNHHHQKVGAALAAARGGEEETRSKSLKPRMLSLVGAQENLNIEFESVSFAYASGEGANQVLDHCSLQIPYGKKVGLMGLSGSGKSTLAKLAAGLYKPQGGLVKIAGMEATSIAQQELLQTLSLIPQEPPLVEGTVLENLKYGLQRRYVESREIEAACKAVALHDDIASLRDGYHSPVSAYSNNLSGGQKQRLAMARALLRRPKILILDEAFAALDIQTAKKVKSEVEKYMAGHTVIYIAHQLETVTDLDYLYIIDKGKVAEQGPPSDLLKRKSGIYAAISQITKSKRS
jgi:ABC-type multidrug transport system fused ATPase/permease subunit